MNSSLGQGRKAEDWYSHVRSPLLESEDVEVGTERHVEDVTWWHTWDAQCFLLELVLALLLSW